MKTKLLTSLSILLTPVLLVGSTYALSAQDLENIERNKSYFYNPSATSYSYDYLDCFPNSNYRGDQIWTNAELDIIKENQAFYEQAANQYGFPWQILAVIHYEEHSLLRTNPDNGEGIYQLTSYTNQGTNENRFEPTSIPVSDDEFMRQTNLAAQLINENYALGLDLNTPEGVKNLFYNYNGHGGEYYKNKALALGFTEAEAAIGEGSPYVMNRYDAQRDPVGEMMNPAWTGMFIDNGVYDENATSNRFGAYVKYIALASNPACTFSNDAIASTALMIGKYNNTNSRYGDTVPTAAYEKAMKAVGNYLKPNGVKPEGASCDQFVSTVVRYSGADPNFPTFGPLVQQAYMDNHPEMYQKINHNFDINNLRDGDILVTGDSSWRHILIYITVNGAPGQASASYGNRTGHVFNGISFTEHGMIYSVYRRINI